MSENHFTEPSTSIWPLLLALGLALLAIGLLTTLVISVVGVVMLVFSVAGWTQEVRTLAPYVEEPEEGDSSND